MWSDFFSRNTNVQLINEKYGIHLFDDPHEDILSLHNFDDLVSETQLCYERMRKKPKHETVAIHDAFHLLLIKELRIDESASLMGPDHWFLTQDHTLPCVDRFISRTYQYSEISTPVMVIPLWADIISQLNRRNVTSEDVLDIFVEFIASEFSLTDINIDVDVVIATQGDWMNYVWMSEEKILGILNQKFALDYSSKLHASIGAKDFVVQDQLRAAFFEKLNSVLGKEFNIKYEEIQSENIQLESQLTSESSLISKWFLNILAASMFIIIAGLLFLFEQLIEGFTNRYSLILGSVMTLFGGHLLLLIYQQLKMNNDV